MTQKELKLVFKTLCLMFEHSGDREPGMSQYGICDWLRKRARGKELKEFKMDMEKAKEMKLPRGDY